MRDIVRGVKRFVARLLVVLFLADLFGVAALQAAPDIHDGYSQERGSGSKGDAPECSHACHASFHFVALPAVAMPVAAGASEPRIDARAASIPPSPSVGTYHPPRALARA